MSGSGLDRGPLELVTYITPEGKRPFRDWFKVQRDLRIRNAVTRRLQRAADGNLGDYKSVGGGVFELRIDFGPGFRIYFGFSGRELVILLCAGDKSTQPRDIQRAVSYWKQFQEEANETLRESRHHDG